MIRSLFRRKSRRCNRQPRHDIWADTYRHSMHIEPLEERRMLAIISGIPEWDAVGPVVMEEGEKPDGRTLLGAGAIEAIAIHPSNPDIVYVGAVNGGIWKTKNAFVNWP